MVELKAGHSQEEERGTREERKVRKARKKETGMAPSLDWVLGDDGAGFPTSE